MKDNKVKYGGALTCCFSLLSILFISPIFIVIMNSFKKKSYINKEPFKMVMSRNFVGLDNYINGIKKTDFFQAFGYSAFITICSVRIRIPIIIHKVNRRIWI